MFCCVCTGKDAEAGEVQDVQVFQKVQRFSLSERQDCPLPEEDAAVLEQPYPEPDWVEPKVKAVSVRVLRAHVLRTADWVLGSGKSDTFVMVEAAGAGQGFETAVVRDSLEPVWDHEGEVQGVPDGAALHFSVWDQDSLGKQLLGKATLPASAYEEAGFHGDLPLSEAGKGTAAFLKVKIRTGHQPYPSSPRSSFRITLDKPQGSTIGADVDLLDGVALHVSFIHAGLVADWNKTCPPELQVCPDQYIMDVNGCTGSSAAMVARLKEDSKVTLTVRRPLHYQALISKQSGSVGLDLNYVVSGAGLLVLAIHDGPVAEWNRAHPAQEVRKGDRIVGVNGKTGCAKDLYDCLKESQRFMLMMSRPALDS